ncbi:hypothetical protein D3C76_1793610 [compost metagenome]
MQLSVKIAGDDAPVDLHDLDQRAVEDHVGDATQGQAGDDQVLGLERLPFARRIPEALGGGLFSLRGAG